MLKTKHFQPQFLVTGVGSLPHAEVSEALKMIWRSAPLAPYCRNCPRPGESSFVGQYLGALIKTGIIDNYETPRFQTESPDWHERLAAFYELYLLASAGDDAALEEFGFSSGAEKRSKLFAGILRKRGPGKQSSSKVN